MFHSWKQRVCVPVLFLCCSILNPGQTQKKHLQTGDPAPAVVLERILQSNQSLRGDLIRALRGKVVVLEFWATWCGPCRKAIPHLNELSKAYRSKSIRFIAITDEEETRIKNFLKYTPIDSWIGLDRDGSVTKAYDVQAWPKTVVIDAKGRIAAIIQPTDLDRKFIDKLLAGRPAVPETPTPPPPPVPVAEGAKAEAPLLQIEVRPAKPATSMNFTDNSFRAAGMKLADLISLAYKVNRPRMVFASQDANKILAVTIKAPFNDYARLHTLLQNTLASTFRFSCHKENRSVEVLVLSMPEKRKTILKSSKIESFIRSDEGQINSTGTTIAFFANALESNLNRIVVDETGLQGNFDIDLYWDANNPDSIFSAIREQIGLILKKEIRSVEFSIFE